MPSDTSVERHQRRTTSTGTPRKRALAQTIAHNAEVGVEDRKPQTGTVDNSISVDARATLDADDSASSGYWLNGFVHRTFG